jgi:hypothetical protein
LGGDYRKNTVGVDFYNTLDIKIIEARLRRVRKRIGFVHHRNRFTYSISAGQEKVERFVTDIQPKLLLHSIVRKLKDSRLGEIYHHSSHDGVIVHLFIHPTAHHAQ